MSQHRLVIVEERWKALDPAGPKPCQLELDLLPKLRGMHQVIRLPIQVCERFRCEEGTTKADKKRLAPYRAGGMVDVEEHLVEIQVQPRAVIQQVGPD
jgi:hypothetical protein